MSYEENPRNEGAPSYGAGGAGAPYTAGPYAGGPGGQPPYPPPPPAPGTPNPGLAALLGLIPGVGAMYNGQFAKGIAHLVIFAVLASLADDHGIFGLFVFGWIVYQVFEAHQTARARRDGQPLPNPFGLNDIGERLGFGKGWSQSATNHAPPAGDPNAPGGQTGQPWNWQRGWQDLQQDVRQEWHRTAGQQGPWNQTPGEGMPSAGQYPPPYPPPPYAQQQGGYVPPPPPPGYVPPAGYGGYGVPPVGAPVVDATGKRSGFPVGAMWLVGLGVILLLTQSRFIPGFRPHLLWPFLLIGLGVWSFLQRSGFGVLQNDGSAAYRWNLLRAVRRAGFLVLVGVLGLITQTHWLHWGSLWPLLLIYFGVFAIAERAAANQMAAEAYAQANPPSGQDPAQRSPYEAAAPSSTSIVPTPEHRDTEEGR